MKSYILIIIISVLAQITYAQFPRPSVSIQSPNAASLGMYGDIPVSQYTGIPQIGIPLYTLEEGKISIPISLSYHASGVRPNQHPGWVGMGWSLNAGGVITRKVRDMPDDIVSGNPSPGLFKTNSLLRPSNANPNYWETSAYINSLSNNNYASVVDTEPDEFDFNFLGYSGSFYVDGESGILKVRSEHQFKVEVLDNNYACPFFSKEVSYPGPTSSGSSTLSCSSNPSLHPKYASEFRLTDLDGTIYYFGVDESAIEFSLNFFQQYNTSWVANAWYLKKIVTIEGRTITFNYDNGNPADGFPYLANLTYSYYTEDFQINSDPYVHKIFDKFTGVGLLTTCEQWNSTNSAFIVGGDLIRPVYLKDIIITTNNATNSHKIVFEKTQSTELKYPDRIFSDYYTYWRARSSNNQYARDIFPYLTSLNETDNNILTYTNRLKWYKLNSFKVYNQRQELITQYNFNYNDLATERLYLNSVSKKETGANTLQTYNFNYYDKSTLPEYFDIYDRTDHWGFLNEGNGGLVNPIISSKNGTSFFTKKQPTTDYNLAKKGTLSSITFPTGGTNNFEYELNSYSKLISPERNTFVSGITTTTTGGLRVKKVTSCEAQGAMNCIAKEYFYVTGFNSTVDPNTLPSSGILAGMPQYSWDYTYTSYPYNVISNVFSANNLLPSSENSNGSHIGYSEVVEKLNGNGYTISKFTNFGTEGGQHMDEKVADASRLNLSSARTIYEPFIDKSYERGKLTSQEVYTSTGNLVNSRSINYSIVNPSVIRAIKASSLFVCGSTTIIPSGIAYKIHKSLYLPSSETNILYGTNGGNGSVTTLTNYQYNSLGFEKIKKVQQSDGSELITSKVYVGDLFVNDAQLPNNAQNYCLNSPRPLEYTSCYYPCVQSGGTNCEVTCNTQCINSYINQRVNKPNTVDLRQMVNSYVLAPVIEQQTWKLTPTATGNEEKLLSGGINFFKKYNNGFQVKQSYSLPQLPNITDLPTANRSYNTFPYSNIDADYNFNFYNKYSSFAPVVKFDDIYGYDSKGNICQFNGRDGVPTIYIWGYQNMYPVATIVGVTYQEIVSYLGYSPNEDTNFQSKLRKEDILPLLQALRNAVNTNKPIAQVTTRTYLSGIGVDSETSPSGLVVSYEYDSFNRLKTVFDNTGKVIKSYSYNYKNQ